jgi:hypothetical protein
MPRRENRRGGRRRSARTGPGQGRQPADQDARLKAPTTIYSSDDGGDLELRGSLNLKARSEYAAVLTGGLDREDAYQRATELLFEHLAVSFGSTTSGSCWGAIAWPRRPSGNSCARACAATWPRTSRRCKHPEIGYKTHMTSRYALANVLDMCHFPHRVC